MNTDLRCARSDDVLSPHVALPLPVPGLVIRYSYLWAAEQARGQDEGLKDRPCAIILVSGQGRIGTAVTVLPITHAVPSPATLGVEIPGATKRRLGLDDDRPWIMLTEANRFIWPGPDLRPLRQGGAASVAYGLLPYRLFEEVRVTFIAALRARRVLAVPRTE